MAKQETKTTQNAADVEVNWVVNTLKINRLSFSGLVGLNPKL
jgi:hypothetical protein